MLFAPLELDRSARRRFSARAAAADECAEIRGRRRRRTAAFAPLNDFFAECCHGRRAEIAGRGGARLALRGEHHGHLTNDCRRFDPGAAMGDRASSSAGSGARWRLRRRGAAPRRAAHRSVRSRTAFVACAASDGAALSFVCALDRDPAEAPTCACCARPSGRTPATHSVLWTLDARRRAGASRCGALRSDRLL